jgi:putative phosphoribosyl transferase
MHHPAFEDRRSAGMQLGLEVAQLDLSRPVVLGLPRGGVPVAAEVANAIHAPLDVIVVRKLGVPHQPELAMGAIGENGVVIVNDDVVRAARVSNADFDEAERRERAVLDGALVVLRAVRPCVDLADRSAVIVDDGIATGATVRAAIGVARANVVRDVVIATPVAPPEVVAALLSAAEHVVCLVQPDRFRAVGQWYGDFAAVDQREVLDLLERSLSGEWP